MLRCLARGLEVWLAYASVEFVLVTLSPLILVPRTTLSPWAWRPTAIILAVYALIGAAAGFLAWFATRSDRQARAFGAASLVAAVAANLVATSRPFWASPSLLLTGGLAMACVISFVHPPSGRR